MKITLSVKVKVCFTNSLARSGKLHDPLEKFLDNASTESIKQKYIDTNTLRLLPVSVETAVKQLKIFIEPVLYLMNMY